MKLSDLQMKRDFTKAEVESMQRHAVIRAQRIVEGGWDTQGTVAWVLRLAQNKSLEIHNRSSECEKCGKQTIFSVAVMDRRVRWCGCD